MIKERQAVFSQNTKTVLQTDHIIRIKQGSNSPPQPKKARNMYRIRWEMNPCRSANYHGLNFTDLNALIFVLL